MANKKLDAFHYHEALDRTGIVTKIIEYWLRKHPVIKGSKEFIGLVDKAGDALGELYQKIGEKSL